MYLFTLQRLTRAKPFLFSSTPCPPMVARPATWARVAGLVVAAALLHAQPGVGPEAAPASDGRPSLRVVPAYASVFRAYQPLGEQTVSPWAQTNAVVGAIGGWRAYAREAAQPDTPPAAQTPAPGGKP